MIWRSRGFLLHFDQVAPWQWLTTNFLHAGLGHLLGNMVFLWAFSLIVEGEIGWWRYLKLYTMIGVTYGAIVQLGMYLFSGSDGVALDPSGAIFGVMAVATCWAPRNEISCVTLIEYDSGPQAAVRLKLAQILIQVSKRPSKGIRILDTLGALPPKQEKLKQQLHQIANKALNDGDGDIEFSD